MKKVIFSFFFITLFCCGLSSQVKIQSDMRNNTWHWGLSNPNTNTWIVRPEFQQIDDLGGGFYSMKNFDLKKGVYNARGQVVIPVVYDDVSRLTATGDEELGLFAVKKGMYWAMATAQNEIITSFSYDRIFKVPAGVRMQWSVKNAAGGLEEKYEVYNAREMLHIKETQLAKIREKQEAEKQAQLVEEARKQKEAQLASFTQYAKLYVEPKIDKWQKKDEFETTSEYKERVTGPNRLAMIEKLTAEAHDLFLKEHAELNKEISVTLGTYDADNGVYLLQSARFGDMLLAVPRNDAPDLRQNFNSYKVTDPKFTINNDKIALMEFSLRSTSGKAYPYNNQQALSYNTYDVDLSAFEFAPIEIASAPTGQTTSTGGNVTVQATGGTPAVNPTLKILSPESGTNYTTSEVVIRYHAVTEDGSTPEIEIFINGKLYEGRNANNEKAVRRASDELTLNLPQEPGECNIMLQFSTPSGNIRQERLRLTYTGDIRKPNLHILAVGVSEYASPDLRLNHASKDAKDFLSIMKKGNHTQYNQLIDPIVLLDKDATEREIKRGLRQLESAVSQDDVVMLYFSGHGDKEGNDTYFLPVDVEKDDLLSTAVDFDLINKAVQRLVDKKCRVVVFMDACYSGALGTKSLNQDLTLADPGIIGFYSSTARQTSQESEKLSNGVFTRVLLEGLQGGAVNENGEVTIYRLQNYISEGVKKETAGKQSPIIQNNLGDFVLFRQ